jgi:hypothetical protein
VKIKEIIEILEAEVVLNNHNKDVNIEIAYGCDLMSDVCPERISAVIKVSREDARNLKSLERSILVNLYKKQKDMIKTN